MLVKQYLLLSPNAPACLICEIRNFCKAMLVHLAGALFINLDLEVNIGRLMGFTISDFLLCSGKVLRKRHAYSGKIKD